MNKILFILGTRPEAIKLAPVIKAFQNEPKIVTEICVTGQHREMLDQVMNFFNLSSDYDLDIMKKDQNLFQLTARLIVALDGVLKSSQPDLVFVHGDTTSCLAGALASYYAQKQIIHIEAGLRTNEKFSPFPEEMNRQLVGRLADFHFAPTENAKENLLREGISFEKIFVTGNTVIDALLEGVVKVSNSHNSEFVNTYYKIINNFSKVILVTSHRRENHGKGIIDICNALLNIAKRNDDVLIIFPVHLNPSIKIPVENILDNIQNVKLVSPLDYPDFIWVMNKSYLIITDSGGVQEEAPSLGKPVLVMRDTTERPEAVEAGTVKLVGSNMDDIVREVELLLENEDKYLEMSSKSNPYGDGKASQRILEKINQILK